MFTLIIITGASRGLGAALARTTAAEGVEQLLIARSHRELDAVGSECERLGATVHTCAVDLSRSDAEQIASAAIESLSWRESAHVVLFNNASQVTPIERLVDLHADDMQRILGLNVAAPIWLAGICLRLCRTRRVRHGDVVNISTGISLHPLIGWSLYCASKAAVNSVTASIALETQDWPMRVRTIAVNPGPLDTDMQREIREADPKIAPDHARFVNLFETGKLIDPGDAAARIVGLLNLDPFPNGQFVDLRNY